MNAYQPPEHRSSSGTCIFFGPDLVEYSSKKKSLIAMSRTEAEYRALGHTNFELLWLKSLLIELGVPFYPSTLLCEYLSNSKLNKRGS